jgi:hypothetical protein
MVIIASRLGMSYYGASNSISFNCGLTVGTATVYTSDNLTFPYTSVPDGLLRYYFMNQSNKKLRGLIIDSASNSPLLLLTYPPDDNIYLQFRQNYVFINQSQVNGLPDALNAKIGNNYASPVFNDGINLVLSNNGNTTSQISFYNSTSIVSSSTAGDIWSMGCNLYSKGVRKFLVLELMYMEIA